jgi:chromosome segregation ATPase
VLLAIAVVYVIASLYFIFDTRNRLATFEKAQLAAVDKLTQRVNGTDREVKASTEALAQKLGMTQQDLQARMSARTAQLERQQKAAEQRLAEQQAQQIGQVTGEVANVKTDLGSTKTDLAATRTDLDATKAKLERAIGDLGVQSGLIARTHDDLEELKRRGDRNYYEFTLQKGAHPTPVSTVSLQLKKTDAKKSKFTLNVVADDKTIEKKDRNVAEPLQFYTGRSRVLYEVVVFSVDKSKISGYLATPKSVPAPISK